MTMISSHDSTTSETSTSNPAQQHSSHQQNATTTSHKTYKTDAHLCITIRWSGRSLSVTAPGRPVLGAAARVVDLDGWS